MDPDVITDLGDGWQRAELRTIGDGTSIENCRRPDLPLDVVHYRVVQDLGVTMIVEYEVSQTA